MAHDLLTHPKYGGSDGKYHEIWLKSNSEMASRRSLSMAMDDALSARRAGLSLRQVSIPLPAVNPNGTISVGCWIPAWASKMTEMSVAYLTSPSSASGTVVIDVKKVSGGTTTALQASAGFDLEGLAAAVPSKVALATTVADTQLKAGDYVYASITSDNADAVDGTAGVLVLTFTVYK